MTNELAIEEMARRRERAAVVSYFRRRNEHVYAAAIEQGVHWPPLWLDEPRDGYELPQE